MDSQTELPRFPWVFPVSMHSKVVNPSRSKVASIERTEEDCICLVRFLDVLCQSFAFLEHRGGLAFETPNSGASMHGRSMLFPEVLVQVIGGGECDCHGFCFYPSPISQPPSGTLCACVMSRLLLFGHFREGFRRLRSDNGLSVFLGLEMSFV